MVIMLATAILIKQIHLAPLDECKGHIKKSSFYPDADDLIRGFLKNNRLKTIVFKEESGILIF
jgi:hypothetical protein